MADEKITSLVIYSCIVFTIVVIFLVTLFVAYQRRKTQLLVEKAEEKRRYEKELAKSQTEIQEQTFKNISWELHDNIGQLLSVAKMQMNMLAASIPQEQQPRLKETADLVGASLQEIRTLSRSLNAEYIHKIGLVAAIKGELNRFNRLNFLNATFSQKGEEVDITEEDEIIVFRILQEFFSNVVKHSRATELEVSLDFGPEKLVVRARDNGVGFDMEQAKSGSGLINMRSRAELITAALQIDTKPNQGVALFLEYPYKREQL